MTAIAEDTDIALAGFDDPPLLCDWGTRYPPRCPLEAAWLAIWELGCPHPSPDTLLCPGHRDELLRVLGEAARADLISRCLTCKAVFTLLRIEAIR